MQITVGASCAIVALTFNTCADENQWVYADGALVASSTDRNSWGKDIAASIPAGTNIVGVKVLNGNKAGGWKGYFSDGRVTDAYSWRCTNVAPADNSWMLVSYDDSKWVSHAAKTYTEGCVAGYPATAMWLWPDASFSTPFTSHLLSHKDR